MKEYSKGILSTPSEHLAEGGVGEYLFSLDMEKKYFVKVSEEQEYKTYKQLKLIHSLFRLLHLSNCMPENIDDEEKVKEFFKIKCRMIKDYGYFDNNNKLKYSKSIEKAREYKNWYPRTISLAKCSKKSLKSIIEYVLNYADRENMEGNLNYQEKKYLYIREELDYRR